MLEKKRTPIYDQDHSISGTPPCRRESYIDTFINHTLLYSAINFPARRYLPASNAIKQQNKSRVYYQDCVSFGIENRHAPAITQIIAMTLFQVVCKILQKPNTTLMGVYIWIPTISPNCFNIFNGKTLQYKIGGEKLN